MIFKTKKYYKNEMENLSIENIKLRIDNHLLKNEIEQLKSEKTIEHESYQFSVITDDINPPKDILYLRLKSKVLNEISKNFEKYVKVSPIVFNPREMENKQYATILIERR